MKLNLPKASKGFTLVELMVVIAIIAILATVGLSVYSVVQTNARDSIRKQEITSFAKSIEVGWDAPTQKYTYSVTNYSADYPDSKPADPLKSSTKPQYCIATSASAIPGAPTTWAAAATCPTIPAGYAYLVNDVTTYNTVQTTSPTYDNLLNSGVRYWRICSRLEKDGSFFCKSSNQ